MPKYSCGSWGPPRVFTRIQNPGWQRVKDTVNSLFQYKYGFLDVSIFKQNVHSILKGAQAYLKCFLIFLHCISDPSPIRRSTTISKIGLTNITSSCLPHGRMLTANVSYILLISPNKWFTNDLPKTNNNGNNSI